MTIAVSPAFLHFSHFLPLIPVSFLLAFLLAFFSVTSLVITTKSGPLRMRKGAEGQVLSLFPCHWALQSIAEKSLRGFAELLGESEVCDFPLTQYLHNFPMISALPPWSVIFMACYYLHSKCSGKPSEPLPFWR